ncbi:cytochrome P450 [Rhodococcus wratislaviensis]|uniref:Putative cytochrome P450 n=1 Tax=Rhodococcus wratislaviensis NBRC 100605 TaxID=1219028 RepID=X0PLP9_RHOWR|nr:cytochrome P450 [Rhodococcus wratislaviensis]GAF43318.1 putative cytochrome P450 [Rhodococcus wratislaviensis NBRC 100605]
MRFNPFSADVRGDPYPVYRQLREMPVHKTLGMWVLTRHADVQAVLRDRSFSAGLIPQLIRQQADRVTQGDVGRIERLARKSLVFTDNPDHARLRALVNRAFTGQAVAMLRPRVVVVAEQLLANARDRGEMDAIVEFAGPLPIQVMCDWLALPEDVRERVGDWTHNIRFLLEPGLMQAEDFSRVCAVVEEFAHALAGVIAQRRAQLGGDLISRLLAAETSGGDRLSDEELIFVCIMCFVAGNETTKSLVGNGLRALLLNPEQDARMRARPDLARCAVTETLRYDSPLQFTKRVATRDVDQIRAGDQVLLCVGAANRDPEVFEDPDRFDITRNTQGNLAFGHGMHGCLGGALAEMQAEVAFQTLYRRAKGLRLLTHQHEWQEHSLIVRGLKHLPVAL